VREFARSTGMPSFVSKIMVNQKLPSQDTPQ
jgi:hypothetical protein